MENRKIKIVYNDKKILGEFPVKKFVTCCEYFGDLFQLFFSFNLCYLIFLITHNY